jgi:2,3-bisphosphoglycerate-independent phosphoglycerate mutase
MKYFILLCDGMADLPIDTLNGKTPMEVAHKPVMDRLAGIGYAGMARTVPDSLAAGSDTANMSVMGYDPSLYYTGRSPIEAVSMGIDLRPEDVAFRVNLVTLSDEMPYSAKSMIDYSSDEITSAEAAVLMEAINHTFGADDFVFYPGISYRHCLVWTGGPTAGSLTPPHDILTRPIEGYLPGTGDYRILGDIMTRSYDLLCDHPVNRDRMAQGLRPANSIWIWGQGTRPDFPKITERYHITGSVISAVDLIFGIGICAGMTPVKVEGATGNIHTNFDGKAQAAMEEFRRGQDYVYLHIEAPDECGHRNELENKIRSIEIIDQKVLDPVLRFLTLHKEQTGEDYRILVMPDHPTPIPLRTHTHDPVPFVIFSSDGQFHAPVSTYSEKACLESGIYYEKAHELFDTFITRSLHHPEHTDHPVD